MRLRLRSASRRNPIQFPTNTERPNPGDANKIQGCDYHPSIQQIAFVDTDTGELQERRLEHREEAEKFYRELAVQGMNSLLADDFIITVEDGSTFSKPGYIAQNGNSSVHVEISEMSDLQVRMHGNTGVVTGAYYEKGTEKGKSYEYRDRLTDVWMNINGRWRLIASHYSLRANP
jgi:ketosteroid isomerase-like protein